MDELSLVYKQEVIIFAKLHSFNLVPLQWHSFPGIEFHYNLLACDLIGKTFKKHFPLIKLGDTIKLNQPEKYVQSVRQYTACNPPKTGNPKVK